MKSTSFSLNVVPNIHDVNPLCDAETFRTRYTHPLVGVTFNGISVDQAVEQGATRIEDTDLVPGI